MLLYLKPKTIHIHVQVTMIFSQSSSDYTRFPGVILRPLGYEDNVQFNAWYLENVAVQSDRNI